MYPVTVVGRILTCISALVGAGMMGMLVSVLVDRYQRVYQRKMYVPEHDLPSINLSETKRKTCLSFMANRFPSIYQRINLEKATASASRDRKIQFIVSFNSEEIDDQETETIITAIQTKVNETIANTSVNVDLKLIYTTNDKLWTTNLNQ